MEYARALRNDLNLRDDLIQVTEGYVQSYKRIGLLTYESDSGRLETVRVTDDLLPEIREEYGIKTLRSITIEDVEKNPEANTIVYTYIPEWYKVLKISNENRYLQNPIYDVRPLDYQIKGNSEYYDVRSPVVGMVDKTSLANKLEPYQVIVNASNNQVYNLLEKELGMFFIFDINFLPSEYKMYEDVEEALLTMRGLAKNLGLLPIDASKGNTGQSQFNQFAVQSITFSDQISNRLQISEHYTQKAYQLIGITPQRLGTPSKYETAEGVKQGVEASYAQTELYFKPFFDYKKRALETHLTVAQYCQTNSKDISVFYTKGDNTKAFLRFSDDQFHLRKFGILPVSNSKKRKELELFKGYLLQTNTLGTDELDLAQLIASDSMSEAIQLARSARLAREEMESLGHSRRLEEVQLATKMEEEREQKNWERDEITNEKDRANKIRIEEIEALGRALDSNASENSLEQINKQADIALKEEKQDRELGLREEQAKRADKQLTEEQKLKWAELNLKAREISNREKLSRDETFRSVINKN